MQKLFRFLIWFAFRMADVAILFVKILRFFQWKSWKAYVRIALIAGRTRQCANCGGVMLPSEIRIFTRDGRPVHGDGVRHFTLQDSRRVICNKAPDDDEVLGYEAAHPHVMRDMRVPTKHFRA